MTLRWGILGTSFISHTVAQSIASSPNSRITAVFGRDEPRLAKFAAKFAISTTHDSVETLLADPQVDVVYSGLPSHMHARYAIAAARRGVPMLSEKALATTMSSARAMIDAASHQDVFLLEGLMYLSHPLMARVGEIVRSGALGRVCGVQAFYAADIAAKANPRGGGTIYNLGCYPVSLLHWVMESAYGEGAFSAREALECAGNVADESEVAHVRDAAATVRFQNGVLATVQSTDSFGSDFGCTIQGDRGSLKFETNPWLPRAGDNVLKLRTYGGNTETIVVKGEYDAFGYQVRAVERCLARKATQADRPSPRWQDSLEIMEFLTEWEGKIMGKLGLERSPEDIDYDI